MTRRLLEVSRGVVVHSEYVARETRQQGFEGPIATIPHGAWIPRTDRNATRHLRAADVFGKRPNPVFVHVQHRVVGVPGLDAIGGRNSRPYGIEGREPPRGKEPAR